MLCLLRSQIRLVLGTNVFLDGTINEILAFTRRVDNFTKTASGIDVPSVLLSDLAMD